MRNPWDETITVAPCGGTPLFNQINVVVTSPTIAGITDDEGAVVTDDFGTTVTDDTGT